jgi:hypothetical protein
MVATDNRTENLRIAIVRSKISVFEKPSIPSVKRGKAKENQAAWAVYRLCSGEIK